MVISSDISIIEHGSREIRAFNWFHFLSPFKWRGWSLPKWIAGKSVNRITELADIIGSMNKDIDQMSKEDQKKIFSLVLNSIPSMIKFHEALEKVDYYQNGALKQSVRRCLDNFYVLEALLKKRIKTGSITETDSAIKKALGEKTIQSMSSKA